MVDIESCKFCAERIIQYFPGMTVDELAQKIKDGAEGREQDAIDKETTASK
jgi:hypothetical protein